MEEIVNLYFSSVEMSEISRSFESRDESPMQQTHHDTITSASISARDSSSSRKKRLRSKHPDTVIYLLEEWCRTHQECPYPSKEEKIILARKTLLTVKQVTDWFYNYRKRHWPLKKAKGVSRKLMTPLDQHEGQVTGKKGTLTNDQSVFKLEDFHCTNDLATSLVTLIGKNPGQMTENQENEDVHCTNFLATTSI